MKYGFVLPRGDARTAANLAHTTEGRFEELTPADFQVMKAYINENRTETTPFDVIMEGKTPRNDRPKAIETVRKWAEVGVTWWLEAMWDDPDVEHNLTRIHQGPPRLE